jgi:hypothetical protein
MHPTLVSNTLQRRCQRCLPRSDISTTQPLHGRQHICSESCTSQGPCENENAFPLIPEKPHTGLCLSMRQDRLNMAPDCRDVALRHHSSPQMGASTSLVSGQSLPGNNVAQRESAASAQLVGSRCVVIARWLIAGHFGRFADGSNGL